MKPILATSLAALTLAGLLASPALAGKRRSARDAKPAAAPAADVDAPKAEKEEPAAPKKPNFGESYGFRERRHATPSGDAAAAPEVRSLTANQIGKVINERLADVEYCWLRLPPSRRVDTTAVLNFSIEPAGKVAGMRVSGELPAGVARCITTVANRWVFPGADTSCEVEHAIALTTTVARK